MEALLWAALAVLVVAVVIGYTYGKEHDPDREHYDNGWEDQ